MSELHEAKRVPTQFTVPRPGEHAWSPTEQRRFWDALQCFPHGPWTDIAAYVGSKSTRQAMTHAQKLRQKLSRWKRRVRSSSKGSTGSKSKASTTVTKATPMATGSPVDGRNALVWPRLMSLTIVRDGGAMRGKSACVEEDGGACDLMDVMDLSPRGIRTHLDLNKAIYAKTAAYGHFGRAPQNDGSFSWEKTDLAPALKSALA